LLIYNTGLYYIRFEKHRTPVETEKIGNLEEAVDTVGSYEVVTALLRWSVRLATLCLANFFLNRLQVLIAAAELISPHLSPSTDYSILSLSLFPCV
jgi:hypothetical protein